MQLDLLHEEENGRPEENTLSLPPQQIETAIEVLARLIAQTHAPATIIRESDDGQ